MMLLNSFSMVDLKGYSLRWYSVSVVKSNQWGFSRISTLSDVKELQDNMQEWSKTWLLDLYVEKCKVMYNHWQNPKYKLQNGISSYLSMQAPLWN